MKNLKDHPHSKKDELDEFFSVRMMKKLYEFVIPKKSFVSLKALKSEFAIRGSKHFLALVKSTPPTDRKRKLCQESLKGENSLKIS